MLRALWATAATVISLASLAQTAPALQGQWVGVSQSPGTGQALQVALVIQAEGGTWKYSTNTPAKRAGPCLGRDLPVQVLSLSATTLRLKVEGSKVVTGCPDFGLTLERVDDATLDGHFGDGRPLRLSRP